MKLSIKKSIAKVANKVFIASKLDELKEHISPACMAYFKKYWKDEAVQYIKTPEVTVYVINRKDKEAEAMRKLGHQVHGALKNEKTIAVYGEGKADLLAFLEGIVLSNYQFLKYFSDKKKRAYKLDAIHVAGNVKTADLEELENLCEAVYWSRDMVNEPVSYLDSVVLAKEIEAKGKAADYSVKVLDKKAIEKLKMGGLLAVNQGSVTPPTFTIIEYKPKNAKNKKPIVLVGKGIVYDTGGLSLKPTAHSMDLMKSDMGGAAAMAGTIHAIALNKIPVHVIGLIPSTDNRPGKNAYAPGDVVTMLDGTTIEVLNTDAEGRMVLADALSYGNQYKPELMIDAATLTGAAVRALGSKTSICMGNATDAVFEKLEKAGNDMHDRVVRFPFWDEWKEDLKSDIADMKNLGGASAGMITAGKFLEHFTKHPYIHIDIAGPAFLEAPEDYKGKGGTGAGVRLLYQFLKNY